MRFDTYFELYENWQDSRTMDNVSATLKSFYGQFYSNNEPNYELIKEGIIKNNKKAKELFKNLFPIRYHLRHGTQSLLASCEVMQVIKEEYGMNILAHGVEEMKGGIHNLLMMCISGCVRVRASFWGNFVDGMPNISPIMHGPFYVIYSSEEDKSKSITSNPKFDTMEYILVPFQEHVIIIQKHLETLVDLNMITKNQADNFLSKLKDYREFLEVLKENKKENKSVKKRHRDDRAMSCSKHFLFSHEKLGLPSIELPSAKRIAYDGDRPSGKVM